RSGTVIPNAHSGRIGPHGYLGQMWFVTSPPSVGFATAWKLRLPNVTRAQTIRAAAATWMPMATGPLPRIALR
ncbi:MAG: hypothetical protein WB579_14075, partial [Bryobacteraceae bacterium]